MKRIIIITVVLIAMGVVFFACKKFNSESGKFGLDRTSSRAGGEFGLMAVGCYQTLPATISASRTLSADSAYLISGCVKVTNNAVLTAPAGTVFLGQKSTNGTLIIERGAKLIATGTSSNPVIMTSDQSPSNRAPGDWGGLVILGKANNNSSSPSAAVIEIDRACGTLTAGAVSGVTTDSDDSGSLSYVQIHYAGGNVSGDEYPSALLLAAVGSNTEIDHIQITNSRKDGMVVRGGTFNASQIVNYDNYKTDFLLQEGYRGKMQYALSLRLNANAHDNTGELSNGMVILNNPDVATNTPLTNVVVSNASFYGPAFCGATPHSDFQNAIYYGNNITGGVFNSVITGWPRGLFVTGATTAINANTGLLKFSYNSFYGYATDAARFSTDIFTWNAPEDECSTNIGEWIRNLDNLECANFGYQAFSSGFNYAENLCNNYCSAAPEFRLSSAGSLQASTFASVPMLSTWFNTSAKPRGAFDTTTNWAAGWSDWCAITTAYCN